jgi:hypothetical protein
MAIELLRLTAHHYGMCLLVKHGGVNVRRFGLVIALMAAVAAVATTGAGALEEQRGPAPPALSPDAPKANVQDQSSAAKSDGGTEIRIPGLGKLGTLPKMDFGLELLYGAAEGEPAQDNAPDGQNRDDQQDLMIHGTVKHRF